MTEHQFPGVFIEEIAAGPKPIEGVDTSTAGLVGVTQYGPDAPKLVTSFAEFANIFGDPVPEPAPELRDKWSLDSEDGGQWWQFPLSVKGFFDNGGRRLFIKRVACDDPNLLTAYDFVVAIESLSELSDADLYLAPGMWSNQIQRALIDRCDRHRDSFAILDPSPQLDFDGVRKFRRRYDTSFAALYYPWLEIDGNQVAPSAHVAGIYARVDLDRGVHTAPVNEEIRGITKIEHDITKREQELLNPEGVNVLRFFPARGNLVWGGRTLSSDPEWKYVNVRRFFTYLERSIDKGTQWVVFEPNNEHLWANVRRTVSDFLHNVWQTGVLQGNKPEQAFFVKCDRTTMTQDDIDNGRLICLVGVAMVRPAEFVIFRIGQWTAENRN